MSTPPKRLGHLVIKVRDLDRAERFYTEVLGLHVTGKLPSSMVFMSARADSSHELALVSMGDEAPGPENSRVGMAHMAWEMGSFEDLRGMYRTLKEFGASSIRISDHGISLGIYFLDPDGNQVEAFYELPREQWRDSGNMLANGEFPMSLEEATDVPVSHA